MKDPPVIIRRQSKQRFPETIFTARKFMWWISLVVLIVSCVIGVGWSRIRQMQEQRYSLPKREEKKEKEDHIMKDSLPVPDVKNKALPQEKQPIPMRLWKRVKKNLVQELQRATFISIAGKYTARGSTTTNTNHSDNSVDISINKDVIVSVESTDTDPSNSNSQKNNKRREQLKRELAQEYSNAFTAEPHLTDQQRSLLQQLSLSVQQEWPDMHQRAVNVAWGGPPDLTTSNSGSYHWWNPVIPHPHHLKRANLEHIDGGYLLYSYLNIMKWYVPVWLQEPVTVLNSFSFLIGFCF